MELTQQQAFFSALEARLTAAGAECFPEPGAGAPQLGDGLGFSLPVGEDFHPALVELMAVKMSFHRGWNMKTFRMAGLLC